MGRNCGVSTHVVADLQHGLVLTAAVRPEIVLIDLKRSSPDLTNCIPRSVKFDPAREVLFAIPENSAPSPSEAIARGRCESLARPISPAILKRKIWLTLAQIGPVADAEPAEPFVFHGMIGSSNALLEVFSRILRVAPHFDTLLVSGETGTGKELTALAIHNHSRLSGGPLVVCNCAAVVDTLFESELFGHVRGAFTGANQDKRGIAEVAENGTLFLDEVGEIPLSVQPKLLRFLQNREVQRVGSSRAREISVQVIAATHRDLRVLVSEGRFREDLYYRLAPICIKLPRLVDRREDLPLLCAHFLKRLAARYGKPEARLGSRAWALLQRYDWPGNVRELENVLSYAALMTTTGIIDVGDFPDWFCGGTEAPPTDPAALLSLDELGRRHAEHVLAHVGGNRAQAARILGISRATLYRLLPA